MNPVKQGIRCATASPPGPSVTILNKRSDRSVCAFNDGGSVLDSNPLQRTCLQGDTVRLLGCSVPRSTVVSVFGGK